jgi:uncharacterized protein (TIRG00374 family)
VRLRHVALRLIGLAILAVILLKLDLGTTVTTLTQVHPGYLALALAADLPMFALKAWRWREMLQMQGIDYPWRDSYLAFLAGLFLGLVTPGRLGELGKALYLRQDRGLPFSEGLANVLMDRLLDLYTILILGTAGLAWFQLLPDWALGLIVLGTVIALLLPGALLSERLALWGIGFLAHVPWLNRYQSRLTAASSQLRQGLQGLLKPRLALPLGLTLLAYALYFTQCWLLAMALNLEIGIVYLAVCLSVSGVLALLPISFSGLGTRELILIVLFAPLGIVAEQAVAFAALFFLTFNIAGGVMGAVAWQLKPLQAHG